MTGRPSWCQHSTVGRTSAPGHILLRSYSTILCHCRGRFGSTGQSEMPGPAATQFIFIVEFCGWNTERQYKEPCKGYFMHRHRTCPVSKSNIDGPLSIVPPGMYLHFSFYSFFPTCCISEGTHTRRCWNARGAPTATSLL